MPIQAETEIHPADVSQVVESVFAAMMGLTAVPTASGWPASEALVSAAVHLRGAREAAVTMQCRPEQACNFAASFLGMPAPAEVDADVRDVMGELVNMIAGNLKCTLRPGIRLSIPSVEELPLPGPDLPVLAYRSAFETDRGPFWLTVANAA